RVGGERGGGVEPLMEGAGLPAAARHRCLRRRTFRGQGGANHHRSFLMSDESRIQTVLLTVEYSTRSSYYLDWTDAFARSPHFAVTCFNLFSRHQRQAARRAIEQAELVVALHACSADTLDFIRPLVMALEARRGRLLMFVANEYNLPWAPLAEKRAFVQKVNAEWVGTQLLLDTGQWLYEGTSARVLALP